MPKDIWFFSGSRTAPDKTAGIVGLIGSHALLLHQIPLIAQRHPGVAARSLVQKTVPDGEGSQPAGVSSNTLTDLESQFFSLSTTES